MRVPGGASTAAAPHRLGDEGPAVGAGAGQRGKEESGLDQARVACQTDDVRILAYRSLCHLGIVSFDKINEPQGVAPGPSPAGR